MVRVYFIKAFQGKVYLCGVYEDGEREWLAVFENEAMARQVFPAAKWE